MDIKDLVMGGEGSLPNAQDAVSTVTATSAPGLPTLTADASTYWKTGGSFVLGLAGMFFLYWGRKSNDLQRMAIGVILTIASIFIF